MFIYSSVRLGGSFVRSFGSFGRSVRFGSVGRSVRFMVYGLRPFEPFCSLDRRGVVCVWI